LLFCSFAILPFCAVAPLLPRFFPPFCAEPSSVSFYTLFAFVLPRLAVDPCSPSHTPTRYPMTPLLRPLRTSLSVLA
jgi:hypothetical protein